MHGHSIPLVLESSHHPGTALLKLLTLALTGLLALQGASSVRAQNLGAEPLFGSTSLQAGFTSTPYSVEVSPGGGDQAFGLGDNCAGYVRFAQPDFVLDYQAGENPLGIFALSDLDITMAINDPAGNWHCNDDSPFLSGTNSGIQFSEPLSGDYQIWIGTYDMGAESIATQLAITEVDASEWASISIGQEEAVYAASFDLNGDIVFGDDSSGFANDGECDDPRFQGPGMAFGSSSNHLFKDASDCRAQYEAGVISLAEPEDMNLSGQTDVFSADTSMASPIETPDAGPFGEVMFALWQAFQAIPGDDAGGLPLPFNVGGVGGDSGPSFDYDRSAMTGLTGIDFGDNSGPFSDDGECDDPRFEGPGAAEFTFEGTELTDGSDCSRLYLEGALVYLDPAASDADTLPGETSENIDGIDFGDNSSVFADDGECDDPRFEGPGVALSASVNNERRDANDCSSLYQSGQVMLAANANASSAPPSSASAAPARTQVSQVAEPQDTYEIGTPRGDIYGATQADNSIFASGTVYGEPIDPGQRGRNAMPSTVNTNPAPRLSRTNDAIDFGDNSSVFANDGECDDPRFEGVGMAIISYDEDLGKDADDCRAAFEAGTITLIGNQ